MRVAINCRSFLKRKHTGIGRYAYNLVQSLSAIDCQNQYFLYAKKRIFDFRRKNPKPPADNFSVKIDYFQRGLQKSCPSVDIYHLPSPDVIENTSAKVVVTVHDMIYKRFPQGHTPQTCALSDQYMRETVEKAEKIICCSQSTMDDLIRYFDVDQGRLRLVYQGVDNDVFYPLDHNEIDLAVSVVRKLGIDNHFILFVGTLEPRKNLNHLLRAFSEIKKREDFNRKLVVVGMKGWMVGNLKATLQELGIDRDVVFLGYVDDKNLRYLYCLAEVFVFPSFYEGFGFPILEAFCCGASVIASSVSSCPEIAQDAALLVDPYDVKEIQQGIERLLDDETLASELKQKAIKRSQNFSFKKTAYETLSVYKELAF